MTMSAFDLTIAPGAGPAVTAYATGEIDTTNAAAFTTAVEAVPGAWPIVLDLTGVNYVDSAGFAALDLLLARQAIVVVLGPDSPVLKAAVLMGLPHHDDHAAAQRSATPAGPES